jgi:hypothetical protein
VRARRVMLQDDLHGASVRTELISTWMVATKKNKQKKDQKNVSLSQL